MTAEQVTLLEPSDLKAIRIVCKLCRGALSIQLNETLRIPEYCPACTERWGDAQYEGAPTAAHTLANSVKRWIAIEREKQPPFTLRFEVNEPTKP